MMDDEKTKAVLAPVLNAKDFSTSRRRLAEIISIEEQASVSVTARVLADPKFAHHLVSVRSFPKWRDKLLNDEANKLFDAVQDTHDDIEDALPATVAGLAKKVALSLARWGATGFATVDPWLQKFRTDACRRCDQNVPAPPSLVYRYGAMTKGNPVPMCKACGCLIERKALMVTETCPLPSTSDPTRTRWDEPITDDP
jgi:hypothetical protein